MLDMKSESRRKLAEDDAIRKIKRLEDSAAELQKNLLAQKQVRQKETGEMRKDTGECHKQMKMS